jgi:hypothetical protein
VCSVVTLLGAHTLGHVHVDFSGYGFANVTTTTAANILTNAWDNTPSVFDNNYFSDHINLVSKSPNRFRIIRNLFATLNIANLSRELISKCLLGKNFYSNGAAVSLSTQRTLFGTVATMLSEAPPARSA